MIDFKRIHRFLRAEFDTEAATGFSRLQRVPSMLVRQFLDYYRSLDVDGQRALADASTLSGARTFHGSVIRETKTMDDTNEEAAGTARGAHTRGGIDVASTLRSNVAWAKWRDEMINGKHRDRYRYASVPILRAYRAMGTMRRKAGEQPPSEWDRVMEDYASSVVGAKAPALRKLVRELVGGRFRGRATKGSGGDWTYEGEAGGGRVLLSVDYGGQHAQLRYNVRVETVAGTLHLARGFEAALGVGHGDWDFITEENAAESIALLGDLAEVAARWSARLFEGDDWSGRTSVTLG